MLSLVAISALLLAADPKDQREVKFVLPADVEVTGVLPHAHYLGKQVEAFATRPDGMEVGRTVVEGKNLVAGTAQWSLPLSARAPHGRWQIAAFIDPKADAIGRVFEEQKPYLVDRWR